MYDSRDRSQQQQQQRVVSPSNGSIIEHSIMEDDDSPTLAGGTFHDSDSELDDGTLLEDDMMDDDDASSSLSIPNESIDFDLVYALHSFAATVEGQANVVKGDSLFLMDDSNSYWWLVRVLKTQEVGYIPAENIETPFERLARLNKHRNVDLAHPTNEEKQGSGHAATINAASPTPRPLTRTRSVVFNTEDSYHHYPPAVWNEDEHIPDDSEYGEEVDEEYESGQEGEHEEEDWDIDDYQQHHSDDEPQKPESVNELSQARPSNQLDPANAPDVQRKVSITPAIAREQLQLQQEQEPQQHQRTLSNASSSSGNGALPPSAIQRQEEERLKKLREEEAELRAKVPANTAATPSPAKPVASPSKLRKERSDDEASTSSKKKKTSSVFGALFGRKEKNSKDTSSKSSISSDADSMRTSEDSTATRRPESSVSPVTAQALQQQQSPHSALSSQLRRQDQEQQARYTQTYLNNKGASSLQPSYGLQSAPSIMPSVSSTLSPPSATRPRPTSLILSPSHADSADLPDLSVLRIFAGEHLDTEATFKTVLLNSSTTSSELIKQAIQRFRLPSGENPADYYLQVKQVEGGKSAYLRDEEHPLEVFESLVVMMEHEREEEEMMMSMLPKVKRSSIASISSVASNLSMHPAIRKLAMNDFSDDSAVKFYLNRRRPNGELGYGDEGEETLIAADTSIDQSQYLSAPPAGGVNVSPERFSSPSFRFALQLIIYADDIPDNMVFDPLTEAIIFKDSAYRSSTSSTNSSTGQSMRRKVFLFPRNVTVAEVIELGLERFGIAEGVVDGGDEVEDKAGSIGSKRRSMASYRVRYTLAVDDGELPERELGPSTKVIEAFGSKQPSYKIAETNSTRRRSIDSAQLLSHHSTGSGGEDFIGPDDPVFVLRRAINYKSHRRASSSSNAPLDELALHHNQTSGSGGGGSSKAIIQAQRRARRDNQQAILSAQANNSRGLDVLLPGNAMLRSSRYEDRPNAGGGERYSYAYVHPDGESYDVSEIVQEEYAGDGDDFLEGVRNTNGSGGTLQRVLSKIQQQRPAKSITPTPHTQAPTMSRATTQQSYHTALSSSPSPMTSSDDEDDDDEVNSRSITPTAAGKTTPRPMAATRQPSSISSVLSYTTVPSPTSPHPAVPQRKLFLTDDDFGVSTMLTIIEYKASKRPANAPKEEEEEDAVDKMFFGSSIPKDLHPKVQDLYKSGFSILDEMDNCLDEWLDSSSSQRSR